MEQPIGVQAVLRLITEGRIDRYVATPVRSLSESFRGLADEGSCGTAISPGIDR